MVSITLTMRTFPPRDEIYAAAEVTKAQVNLTTLCLMSFVLDCFNIDNITYYTTIIIIIIVLIITTRLGL